MRCLDDDHYDIAMVTIDTDMLRLSWLPVARQKLAQVVLVGHARQAGEEVFYVSERVFAVALAGDDVRIVTIPTPSPKDAASSGCQIKRAGSFPRIIKTPGGNRWTVTPSSDGESGAEAKSAFHLRQNVASFVEYFGRNHCLFFTITDEANLHPTQFARRWNSFLVRNGKWIVSYIRVLEPQKQGRPHYHLLVAV
jgi:hypothetical protein